MDFEMFCKSRPLCRKKVSGGSSLRALPLPLLRNLSLSKDSSRQYAAIIGRYSFVNSISLALISPNMILLSSLNSRRFLTAQEQLLK
jgi:hypothetical protein